MSDYASQIATAAYNLLTAGLGTTFRTYRKTPMLQVQPSDLPALGVYIQRERREPDGQSNIAEPRFVHQLTLGFSGAVHVETDKQNELHALEEWMTQLDDILLSDARFVSMTEGVTSMDRVSQYAKIGEVTLFEIRVEMTVQFRSYWPPRVTDILEKIVITTQYPDKEHADAGTPQLTQVIVLDQGT